MAKKKTADKANRAWGGRPQTAFDPFHNLRQRQRLIVELIPQLGKTAGVMEPWIANVISQSIEA
jgi:hypothetical protein